MENEFCGFFDGRTRDITDQTDRPTDRPEFQSSLVVGQSKVSR